MNLDKKCVSPVVATALLLVVAVVGVVGFQTWFGSFSSNVLAGVEEDSSGALQRTNIETIMEDQLYFNNGNSGNVTIRSVKIGDKLCNLTNVSVGASVQNFSLKNCTQNLTDGFYEVVIVTDTEVISRHLKVSGTDLPFSCSSLSGEWVLVPGNPTFSTSDFCVMKYEAKWDGTGTIFDSVNKYCGNSTQGTENNCPIDGSVGIISKASDIPLTRIYQSQAKVLCSNLGSNYHLMTNDEWMTIARNIELQSSNWANGIIGSTIGVGGLKRGNVGVLDSISYDGSNPADRSLDTNPKAMHVLSNGESIWDFSGNVNEMLDTTFNNNVDSSLGQVENWYEWNIISGYNYLKSINASYTSNNGIGQVYTDNTDAWSSGTIHIFLRGGYYGDSGGSGIYTLRLDHSPNVSLTWNGFRCVYTIS